MVHVSSSRRSRGDEAEDERVDATGYIRLFYSNFTVFVVLGHKDSLVISFSINRTQGLMKRIKNSSIHLPPSSHSCFLRGVCVLHDVRDEMRESERSLQSSKEWEDVVAVFTPYKLLIHINIVVILG
jgi:hypothetical protein